MQYDNHVWAWRQYRHMLRGFWAGLREIGLYQPTGS